jgi:hypothetical protein
MNKVQLRFTPIALVCALIGSPSIAVSQSSESSGYRGTADDFAEISQLFARYSIALDSRDAAQWAAVFTKKGMFHAAQFCAVGPEELAGIVKNMGGGAAPQSATRPKSHHVSSVGPIVYLDKNHATVQSFLMVVGDVSRDRTGGGITTTAIYEDKLERENGRWLIADRLVVAPGDGPPKTCPPESR